MQRYVVNPRYADLMLKFDSIQPGLLHLTGDTYVFEIEDTAPIAKALNALDRLPADLILIFDEPKV
jgi:hypothetical protein